MTMMMMQVFEYFDKEVTRANGYQVKEAYSVSQDLLAVLDGESVVTIFLFFIVDI